jgi:hypothetical protein
MRNAFEESRRPWRHRDEELCNRLHAAA